MMCLVFGAIAPDREEDSCKLACDGDGVTGRDEGLRDGREQGLREGRDEGLRDGREQGLRDAVRIACELVGIELTDDRNAKLESSSIEQLEALLTALKRTREWPQ